MIIAKSYRSAFIVETSKLTRLLNVIKNVLDQHDLLYRELFRIEFNNGKVFRTDSLQQVLDLDNSKKSRVEKLDITRVADPKSDDDHVIFIEFDGRKPVVKITTTSKDQKIAEETMSVAEEQVERMLQGGIAYRLYNNYNHLSDLVAPVMITLISLLSIFVLLSGNSDSSRLYRQMWLTSTDLTEIAPLIEQSRPFSSEQTADILMRQIKNLIGQARVNALSRPVFADWRVIIVLLPCVIVLASFFALRSCYPPAVFAWGDAEESHRKLVERRNWIWNAVIVTVVLGIVGNLAVFAFGSLIGSNA